MMDNRYTKRLYGVFDKENQRQIQVPVFQRAYLWGLNNWEKLLDDVIGEEETQFMGVLIGVGEGDTSYPIYTLIDGQQRLTTLSFFILGLYKRVTEICENEQDKELIVLKDDIEKRLTITKKEKILTRLILSKQNSNKEDYEYLAHLILMPNKSYDKPANFGNRRISYGFNFFSEYCQKEVKSLEDAKKLYEKLKNLTFVELEEDDFSNAFKLFEVLNYRGLSLSAMDIIRNAIFKELHSQKKDLIEYDKMFNRIMNNLLDSTFQTRFLRQFYMAFKGDETITVKGVSKATISKVIMVYEKLAKRNTIFLLEELEEKSEIYKEFIVFENGNKFSELYENLMNLGISPAYTLLLYSKSKKVFNDDNYEKLLLLLRNFFVRRNILDIPPTRELDNLFMKLVETIEEKIKEDTHEEILLEIIKEKLFTRIELKNDDLFKEKLSGDIYEINTEMTRYLLCLVEENLRSKDSRINLWEKNKSNKLLFTIEHILPQKGLGKNNEWVKELGANDEKEAIKIRDEFCHKLGNLTLTTSNPNLSDFNFVEKKNRVDRNKKHVGYNNGFKINEYVMKQQKWNVNQIKERTDFLINEIIGILEINKK
ncbi:DUF262 domain-containing HNH endonuclease family protein [archaeon]|nr:DUF262 domain-containing HNH endonuclease family protein [Nanoarchaeota archaeon]MCG2723689.1 DUF262 domain-containing HNH endonuclease family protein [archaeon]